MTNEPLSPRGLRIACALLAGLLLTCPAAAQTLSDPTLAVTTVVAGTLESPTAMAFLAPGDFLVLEKAGRVRRVLNGVLQATPALTVVTNSASEYGLLGIAINSETPRKVFLYYTEAASPEGAVFANRVYRYTWNVSNGLLESPQLVLDLPVTPGPSHNGGTLLLGPVGQAPGVGDGALLYTVIGDLNRNGQLQNFVSGAAPTNTSVILRVRQDGTAAPGNPFTPYCGGATTQTCSSDAACGANGPCQLAVAKYFAYGVRNSFGLALDPLTGSLWDTENGQDYYDEVNCVAPGFNSGWERIMGPVSEDPEGTSDLWSMPGAGSTYSDPEFSWSLPHAPTAIVLPVHSGLGFQYDRKVLVGSFNTGQLYALPLAATRDAFDFSSFPDLVDRVADNNAERDQLQIGSGFGGSFSGITDLKVGPDGALYVVSIGGSIYRVAGPGLPSAPALSGLGLAALGISLAGAAGFVLSSRRAR